MKASKFFVVFLFVLLAAAPQGFAQNRRAAQDTVERGGWQVAYGAELRGREAEAGEFAPGLSLRDRRAARDWARHLIDEAVRQAEGRHSASALYSFGRAERNDAGRMLLETVSSLLRGRSGGESRMERGPVSFKAGVMVYVDPYRGRQRFVPYAGIRMQRAFDRSDRRRDRSDDYNRRRYDRQPPQPEAEIDFDRRPPRSDYGRGY
uniref:hypothetical protein n=1 Tax=Candidatus Electronema sp. TaxID=2698783 RepID=UPI004056FD1B